MILPRPPIAGILSGSITACRVPLTTFTATTSTLMDGRTVTRDPTGTVPLRAARERPDDLSPSKPAPGGGELGKLTILEARQVMLDETTDDDARAEGYANAEAWALSFMEVYGAAVTGTVGWLLTFELDRRERPRLHYGLAWDPGSDDGRRRAPEPEAVDPRALQTWHRKSEARWKGAQPAKVGAEDLAKRMKAA